VIRRVQKGRITRAANNDEVVRYAAALESAFTDWLGSGRSALDLGARLQDLAEGEFAKAYLRGKQQALRKSTLADDDRQAIAQQLASNMHYLRFSLEAAIETRRQLARILDEDESKVLDSAFGARVRLQYGGRLWQVIEAGYLAGVKELTQRVRARSMQPALAQATEDDIADDEFGDELGDEEPSDADLAAGLGLSLAGFLDLLDRGNGASWTFGTEYLTEDDKDVCEPCASDAGEYWLPDEPPLPGDDCEGSMNCRCHVATIFDTA
jgi:hypothetical protein